MIFSSVRETMLGLRRRDENVLATSKYCQYAQGDDRTVTGGRDDRRRWDRDRGDAGGDSGIDRVNGIDRRDCPDDRNGVSPRVAGATGTEMLNSKKADSRSAKLPAAVKGKRSST